MAPVGGHIDRVSYICSESFFFPPSTDSSPWRIVAVLLGIIAVGVAALLYSSQN